LTSLRYCVRNAKWRWGNIVLTATNPEFEKVTAEAGSTVNDAKRAKVIAKAVWVTKNEVPSIVVFNMVLVFS